MTSVDEPRLASPLADDLGDSTVGQPAPSTNPEPPQIDVGRALPGPDVPAEGTNHLGPDGNHAFASPFAEHPEDALVQSVEALLSELITYTRPRADIAQR
jgi:hypothetical protein